MSSSIFHVPSRVPSPGWELANRKMCSVAERGIQRIADLPKEV